MKRTLVALMLIAALIAPAFGQDAGSAWIDPQAPFASSSAGGFTVALPTSILAFVSNGIWTDEIDVVVRNPLSLSDYSGYTLWTLYGNYEFLNQAFNAPSSITGTEIDPFDTVVLNDANVGNFQAGIGMPLPFLTTWRLGLLGGTQFTKSNMLDNGGGVPISTIDSTVSSTIDADADGVVSATTSTVIKAEDQSTTSTMRLAAGLDMGFLGVSVYAFSQDTIRTAGASRTYSWTDGADDDVWAGQSTAQTTLYGVGAFGTDAAGTGAVGTAKNWANSSQSLFGAVGQLPLTLFGMQAPITAKLAFNTASGTYGTAMPTRYSNTVGYVSGNDAAKVSTYSWTGSTDVSALWDPTVAPGASVNVPALVTDPSKSGYGSFATSLGAWINPIIGSDGPIVLKPRFGLDYSLVLANKSVTQTAYSSASIATAASATNNVWAYSNSAITDAMNSGSIFLFDIGSLAEFKNAEDTIGLGVGLYLKPAISLSSANVKSDTATTSRSWTDQNGAAEVTLLAAQTAAGISLTDAAQLIANGGTEGSSVLTTTTTYAGATTSSLFGITMSLPVSARISFFNKKLTLVGGYVIELENSVTYTNTPDSTLTQTLVMRDSAGAEIFNSSNATHYPVGQSAANNVSTLSYWDTNVNQVWTGTMGFMARWTPNETMTIDMSGTSIKAAFTSLDGFFSLGNGFMPSQLWDFVDALTLSVTFHF